VNENANAIGSQEAKRTRGLGNVYERGRVWWLVYFPRGRRIRESSGSRSRAVALALLKKRVAQVQSGKPVGPAVEKLTLKDLASMIENDYGANGQDVRSIKAPLAHLLTSFDPECKARDLTTDVITKYVTERQQAGAANATINRSLSALKRAFHLAEIAGKVASVPHIPMLSEDGNARQGFLSHHEFTRLRDALPEDLRDPIAFLYFSGWRVGEMRSLEWRDIDLVGQVVRLRPANSKNKRGRVLPLRGELLEIIQRAHARRRVDCPYVFYCGGKRRKKRCGISPVRPVGSFRKSWQTACKAAGLGAILVHDLRRTAVRNLIRAGVPEKMAMAISGHQTRSVFDRYDIVTEDDLAHAIEKVHDHLAAQPQTAAWVIPLKAA
jgi:integrase